jgi:4-amino-4-deoxychorismate lyase
LPGEIQAVTSAHCLGATPDLAGIKHCSRLEQVLARARLKDTGSFEGLMGSSSGLLISGTMSNVFLELDGELVTPALDRCGIAGVLREVVLREAALAGVALRVADLPFAVLERCSGLALSNVRLGLLPAHAIDGRALVASPLLRNLVARVEALDE